MQNREEEAMRLFKELSPDNQETLLMYARVAHEAEKSVKKSINRALKQEVEEKNIEEEKK
jgi:hypothetical protein